MALTPKQAKFVAAYVAEPNATRAAIAAGYSEKTAYSIGAENLSKPEIVEALAQAGATALQRVQASQDEAIGTAEWIIRNAAETHREARENGQYGPAVTALGLIAKRLPEFKDGVTVDNRSVTFTLPEGTTLEDLKRLRQELQGG